MVRRKRHRITNDDGPTSNVVALYRALKAKGNDIMGCVPVMLMMGFAEELEQHHGSRTS